MCRSNHCTDEESKVQILKQSDLPRIPLLVLVRGGLDPGFTIWFTVRVKYLKKIHKGCLGFSNAAIDVNEQMLRTLK